MTLFPKWRPIIWFTAALLSAYACWLVVNHATPVDEALPFIAVVLTCVAAVTHPALQLAVPLLMAGAIALHDEHTRLIWYGVVIGVAVGSALTSRTGTRARSSTVIAIASILLLRWIPFSSVLLTREVILLLIAIGIVWAFRWTPFAVAIAVSVTLVTPAIPLRTLAFPLAVLIAGTTLRAIGMPAISLSVPSAFAVAVTLAFFAWSGAFARSLPLLLRPWSAPAPRAPVQMALRPAQSVLVEVPRNGRALILSGANMPRLTKGTILGRIDPGARIVRMGDLADWGARRREHFYASRNPLPRDPAGQLRGYGQEAWFDGAGRVPIQPGMYRVTADPSLPRAARLQIDAVELERR
ncbi:MAG: hypothetical protein ABIO78_02545 [Thermoanaerobaculia bacterium]